MVLPSSHRTTTCRRLAALFCLTLIPAACLVAEDFVWKTATDGSYADKTKWLMNQGGVSVNAPRAPSSGDAVTLRDGAYSVFLNGDSAGPFYAASDNTLSVGGGFTVGDFIGSPFIAGGGTLTASTWSLSPSNFNFPHAVINAGHVTAGTFHMPGSGLGLEIKGGGTLECTSYLHGSGFGRKPVWVSGTGSHFTVGSAITLSPQLEIHLDDGGGASLGAVSGGAEFSVNGMASVLHTGPLTTAKFQIADGTAITSGNATLQGGGHTISGVGQWHVAGNFTLHGTFGPTLTLTDQARLSADSLELDNHGHLVAGTSLEDDVTVSVAGTLTKKVGTLQAMGALIECGTADFLPGEAALGQIPVDFAGCHLKSHGPVTVNTQVRMAGCRNEGTRCVLGSAAGQRGILDATEIVNRFTFPEGIVVGAAGAGAMTLEGELLEVETPSLTIGESAGSVGMLRIRKTLGQTFQESVELSAKILVGKAGDGTFEIGEAAKIDIKASSGDLIAGQDPGSVGRVVVTGMEAELQPFLADGLNLLIGQAGRGELTISEGGLVEASSCVIGAADLDNRLTVAGPVDERAITNLDLFDLTLGAGGRATGSVVDEGKISVGNLVIGSLSAADTRLTLDTGGTCVARRLCRVGDRGRGRLIVKHHLECNGLLAIADSANANGSVEISGLSARLTTNDNASVILGGGTASTAAFSLAAGAQARTPVLNLAPVPGSTAALTVSDTGTTLLVTQVLEIGRLHRSAGPATATVSSGGRVDVLRDLRVGRTGVLDVSGGIVVVGSALTPPAGVLRVGVGGFAGIAGTLIGNEEIGSGAHFAPGASPGTAEIQGSLALQAGSTLDLEIAGTTPGSGHDVVHTTGALSVAGAVAVKFIDGFAPAAGQKFTLLRSGGALTWSPTGLTVSGLAAGFSWTLAPDGAGNVVFTAVNAGTAISQPVLEITAAPTGIELAWPSTTGWTLEEDNGPGQLTGWHAVTPAPAAEEGFFHLNRSPSAVRRQFFRLRK